MASSDPVPASRGMLATMGARFVLRVTGLVALLGCGPPAASPRGFDSRQVLAIRDPLLSLRAFTQDEGRLYVSRYGSMPAASSLPPPYNLSTVDLVSGDLQLVAPAVLSMTALAGRTEGERTIAVVHYPSEADVPPDFNSIKGPLPDPLVLRLIDEAGGESLEIPNVSGVTRGRVTFGSSVRDPIAIPLINDRNTNELWFGPPAELRAAPSDTNRILGFDAAGAFDYVIASGNPPRQTAIRRLPFDGSGAANIVSAAIGDRTLIFDETGSANDTGPGFGGPELPNYACADDPNGSQADSCYLVYARSHPVTGQVRLFARSTTSPLEVVLPGALTHPDWISATPSFVLWTARTATGTRLHSWAYGDERAGGCDVPDGAVIGHLSRPSGRRFAAVMAQVTEDGHLQSAGQWVLGTPGGPCHVTENTSQTPIRQFSPDESTVVWIDPSSATSVIHLTNVDTGADRAIPIAGYVYDTEYLDSRRLVVLRSGGDGTGIFWIDLQSEPIAPHIIGDRVSMWAWLNARWLLIGDSKSAQDDTFTLRLLDADTGDAQVISRSVADFSIPWLTPPPGATTLPVAYLVRGRGPSAQDGIWLAQIPLEAFTPSP